MKRLSSKIKRVDAFGEGVGFTIGGEGTHKTCLGTLITILVYAIVLIYGTNKFHKFKERADTTYQTKFHRDGLSATEEFTFEEIGANFAIGFGTLTQEEALEYV